ARIEPNETPSRATTAICDEPPTPSETRTRSIFNTNVENRRRLRSMRSSRRRYSVDYGIRGRTALVVGGSKGIGFEVARMLAAEGCQVAVVARTQRHIDRAVMAITEGGGDAIGVSADMSTEAG